MEKKRKDSLEAGQSEEVHSQPPLLLHLNPVRSALYIWPLECKAIKLCCLKQKKKKKKDPKHNTLSYKIHFYKYFFTRTQFEKTIISS